MNRPDGLNGLRHLALSVKDLEGCERFYVGLLGMRVEWRPDADNLYLTSGTDNLALHRAKSALVADDQRLDHFGFILREAHYVDEWHDYLKTNGVGITHAPKTHRDGARSFYCRDPDGNLVQFIHHPPIANVIP
ncbi:MAG TPA: VOC family protein [Burkholderiales bacterium]|nr:VOC family protein [Burkholderiales bacterium]